MYFRRNNFMYESTVFYSLDKQDFRAIFPNLDIQDSFNQSMGDVPYLKSWNDKLLLKFLKKTLTYIMKTKTWIGNSRQKIFRPVFP